MSRWCGSTRPVRLHGRGSETLFGAADAAERFAWRARACPRPAWNKNAEVVHQRPPLCRRLPQTGEKTGRRRLADASGPCAGMGRPPYRQPPAKDLQKMAASADAGPRGAADGSLDASPSPPPSPPAPSPRRTPPSDASARPASPRSRPPFDRLRAAPSMVEGSESKGAWPRGRAPVSGFLLAVCHLPAFRPLDFVIDSSSLHFGFRHSLTPNPRRPLRPWGGLRLVPCRLPACPPSCPP